MQRGLRAAGPNLSSRELRQIEGVRRVAHLPVPPPAGMLSSIGPDAADVEQPPRQPLGRCRRNDIRDCGRVPRAQVRVFRCHDGRSFDPDRQRRERYLRVRRRATEGHRAVGTPSRPHGRGRRTLRQSGRLAVISKSITASPPSSRLDRRDLEAAQPERLGDLLGRRVDVDEITRAMRQLVA